MPLGSQNSCAILLFHFTLKMGRWDPLWTSVHACTGTDYILAPRYYAFVAVTGIGSVCITITTIAPRNECCGFLTKMSPLLIHHFLHKIH